MDAIWRLALALVVASHGIGHVLFWFPLVSGVNWGQQTRSWLLGTGLLAQVIGTLLWLPELVLFMAAGWGLWVQADWWRTAALTAAAVSLAGLVLYPPNSPSGFFAAIFDVAVLAALIIFHWPPSTMIGP